MHDHKKANPQKPFSSPLIQNPPKNLTPIEIFDALISLLPPIPKNVDSILRKCLEDSEKLKSLENQIELLGRKAKSHRDLILHNKWEHLSAMDQAEKWNDFSNDLKDLVSKRMVQNEVEKKDD